MTNKEKWEEVKSMYKIGSLITGTVVQHRPFGIFLDLGLGDILGLVRIVDFVDNYQGKKKVNYPDIGQKITTVLLWFDDNNDKNEFNLLRCQVSLSLKPSHFIKYRHQPPTYVL
ncbi:MAG: S1 RNA-binding domain-containing protein [Saprospiraceae bacterium]|nr:S1 RNA-binding domain-containing protein [Saprospiraceae bacterium]